MVQTTRLIGGLVVFMISLHLETGSGSSQGRFGRSSDPFLLDPLPTSCTYITGVVSLIPYIDNDHLRAQSPPMLYGPILA